MTLTKAKLAELRRIRDGATPCDDEYIAAFDPVTTGELLDAIAKMKTALEHVVGNDAKCPQCWPYEPARVESHITEVAEIVLTEVFGEDET